MRHFGILLLVLSIAAASLGLRVPHNKGVPRRINEHEKALLNKKLKSQVTITNIKAIDPNEFVDNVLQLVDEMIVAKGYDPYELVDGEFLGVHYDGWISGFSTMERVGDASVIIADATIDVTVGLQMTNLAGNFSFWFTLLGITISGGATATIDDVQVHLALRFVIDSSTQQIIPYVDDLQITEIGFISVDVFGLGPFDYLADLVADFIVNLVKYLFPIIFDGVIKDIVQQVLDNIFNVNAFMF